jgi:hypothetical protein
MMERMLGYLMNDKFKGPLEIEHHTREDLQKVEKTRQFWYPAPMATRTKVEMARRLWLLA